MAVKAKDTAKSENIGDFGRARALLEGGFPRRVVEETLRRVEAYRLHGSRY